MDEENAKHYAAALIGATENMLDRGVLTDPGTQAVREIIKRLQAALGKEKRA